MTDTRYTNAGTREEWVRADTIPAAQIAEARAEALREAAGIIKPPRFVVAAQESIAQRMHKERQAILNLIDASAPAPAQPSVQEGEK